MCVSHVLSLLVYVSIYIRAHVHTRISARVAYTYYKYDVRVFAKESSRIHAPASPNSDEPRIIA